MYVCARYRECVRVCERERGKEGMCACVRVCERVRVREPIGVFMCEI